MKSTEKLIKEGIKALEDDKVRLQDIINRAIDLVYTWGETLNPKFQKEMLDILLEENK